MRPSGRSLLVTAHMTHVHGRDDIDHSHGASTRTQIMPRMYHIDTVRVLLEKARGIGPFAHAGFDPSGKIRLTP